MRTRATRPGSRLFLSVIAVVTLAAAVVVPTLGATSPAGAAEDPRYTLDVSDATDLVDGQGVLVSLQAKPGFAFARRGRALVCRADAEYTKTTDLDQFSGNCPFTPISSSASTTPPLYTSTDGTLSFSSMQVGIGSVEWGPASNPKQFALTCDPTHPCRLVIDITNQQGTQRIIDSSTLLTYSYGETTAACAATEPDAIATGGSERMSGAWIRWSRAICANRTGSMAPTKGVFTGEGPGQAALATSFADLVYSAVGPTFGDPATPPQRATVSVPVALNATVIGVLGGRPNISPDWPIEIPKPYVDLKATMPELATLFGSSKFDFEAFYDGSLRERNPELEIGSIVSDLKSVPLAPAGSEAVTWFATQAFDTQAGDQWRSSKVPVDGNDKPDTPRGVFDSFALADPPFSFSFIELYSSNGKLKGQSFSQFEPQKYGPIWILTDLATARELGIPTVAIPNSSGEFIQPTEQSLLAAVPDLELRADGTYLPQIGAVGEGMTLDTDSPGAYPLTFVEHAVVPTEPLVDTECVPRTGAQALLAEWLAFVTGPGQAELPGGLVPLTPAMAAQAAASQALVGTATLTGACAALPPTDPEVVAQDGPTEAFPEVPDFPFESPSSVSGPIAPGGRNAGATGGTGGGTGGSDESAAPVDVSDDGDPEDVVVAEIAYPDPTGGGAGNGWATALALVVLAVLVAIGGMLSSGRRPSIPGGNRS